MLKSITTICINFYRSQFWMELFADLREAGYFNGSHEHQCLLRYCFGDVIQKDLDECVRLWNSHRIRPSRTAACPGGVPNENSVFRVLTLGVIHHLV